MWSPTSSWAASAAWWPRTGTSGSAPPSRCTARFGAVSQVSGLRVFPRLDPPHPRQLRRGAGPAERRPARAAHADGGSGGERRLAEREVLYVDTDLKIDLPEARGHRPRGGGRPRPRPGLRGPRAGHLLGGGYVNRFNFYDRSYKVIPRSARRARHGGPAPRPQDQDPGRPAGAGVHLHLRGIEHGASRPHPLRTAERGARLRRRPAGITRRKACRPGAGGAVRLRPAREPGVRRGVAADPPRGLGPHGHPRLRRHPDLPRAGGPVQELPRPADRARGLGALAISGRRSAASST